MQVQCFLKGEVKLLALTIKVHVSSFIPWKANGRGPKRYILQRNVGNIHAYTFPANREPKSARGTTFLGLRENSKRRRMMREETHNCNCQSDSGLIGVLKMKNVKEKLRILLFLSIPLLRFRLADIGEVGNKYCLNCSMLCHLHKPFFFFLSFLQRMPSVCMLQLILQGHLVGATDPLAHIGKLSPHLDIGWSYFTS